MRVRECRLRRKVTLQREAYRRIRLTGTLSVVRNGYEDEAARVISRPDTFAIVDAASSRWLRTDSSETLFICARCRGIRSSGW
jgi:hypothetical protein